MLYRKKAPLLLFLMPSFLLMITFLYYPFIMNIINSLFEITSIVGTRGTYIGLQNYQNMLSDPNVQIAVKNTLLMMVLTLVFQVGIALVLALMVDSVHKGQQFFRVVYFFPIVISATAIGLMFSLFYDMRNGMLNQVIKFFGGTPVNWLGEGTAFTMVAIPVIWQYVGFYFVILLTGLSGISDDIFESAAIDGATGLKKIWYITLPMMRSVLVTCTTLSITGAIKVFDLPSMIARNGAPKGQTFFLGTYMHNQTFVSSNVDYGAAISVLIVVLGVIIAQGVGRLLERGQEM